MLKSYFNSKYVYVGTITTLLSLIAYTVGCSPTKFSPAKTAESVCKDVNGSCVVIGGITNVTDSFIIGSGKVDILFVNDNSASMSINQKKVADKFDGFVQNLINRKIDFRIAMTSTDLVKAKNSPFIQFSNGNLFLSSNDGNVAGIFKNSISRSETLDCEDFIKSAYYSFGKDFQSSDYYQKNYSLKCPSSDERGIYTAGLSLFLNGSKFLRSDANLHVIVLSNEDVRSGNYLTSSAFTLDEQDTPAYFINKMNEVYPAKYWEFSSVVVRENSCAVDQAKSFVDNKGVTITDSSGSFVVGANVGLKYMELSQSSMSKPDGVVGTRGKTLSICDADYSANFSNISAQILDSARVFSLKCSPIDSPVFLTANGAVLDSSLYVWDSLKHQVTFKKGTEGNVITAKYKCNETAVK